MGEMATAIALLLAINGLDDLVIDLIYLWHSAKRTVGFKRHFTRATARTLESKPARPIAVLIPAWQEAGIIGAMIDYVAAHSRYPALTLFIGTYPNDPATTEEIAQARHRYPEIDLRHLILPHAGPTTKADCLNHLYRAARGTRTDWAAYVLHDAEDVIHSDEPFIINHLIDRKSMIQMPVRPIPRPGLSPVTNHYADEFAENHLKTMRVRELIAGSLPSAGVGCAFNGHLFDRFADERQLEPFDPQGMTEDYEVALTFTTTYQTAAFVRLPVAPDTNRQCIDTREYFPASFAAAVRQKARWLVGIIFQGSRQLGWSKNWRQNYMLYRDRKPLIMLPITLMTYGLLLAIVITGIAAALGAPISSPTRWLDPTPTLTGLFVLNALLLANRLLHRIVSVWWVYGPAMALGAIIRVPFSDAINVAALARALFLVRQHRRSGRPLRWAKTEHDFPDDAQALS